MSGIVDFIFGGSDDTSQQAQVAANTAAQGNIEARAGQARQDVLNLVPIGDINRNIGFNAALQALQASQPQQLSTFQQGNVQAQGTIAGGLPQIQSAILGTPTDFSAFQPQQVSFDPSFLQQEFPQFIFPTGQNVGSLAALLQG